MAQPHSSVLEAELYLQAVHTQTNQLTIDEQIRDLVVFSHSLINSRKSTAQALWPKLDSIVNSLLQTSEHLQEAQDAALAAKTLREKCNASSSVGLQNDASQSGLSNNVGVEKMGGLVSGGGASNEEIGDIEWEASRETSVNFQDVVGCASAIDAIRESVVIPMQFPALFKRLNVKRSNGIMLYGPPGTGKSMIARATASEVNACFFNASCAELTSRWVGGSEKKLQSLFAAAVRNSPCIVFFDEVDSIACKREGDGSIADQRLTNQLLIELDKIFLAQSEVFVIAATNLPWQIDLAVMRRFPHTVYIALPDHDSRKRMFRSFFASEICSDDNIVELASHSEHMSGSDIANVVNSILFEPIRILCRTTHFLVTVTTKECAPDVASALSAQNSTPDAIQVGENNIRQQITVASAAEVQAFNSKHAEHESNNCDSWVLQRSLSELVAEYGEGCINMPPVEFSSICDKVKAFRPTVSHEYLEQYVKFHDQ